MFKYLSHSGSCSTTGRNTSGILKAMGNLSEMLRDSCLLDENELDEHEHTLLQSVIENLQTCIDRKKKVHCLWSFF